MSAVFNQDCPFCGRPQFLWGGATCDVCDADSNGINDRDEPIGTGLTATPSLFGVAEKGWLIAKHEPPAYVGFPGFRLPVKRPLDAVREAARPFLAKAWHGLLPHLPDSVDKVKAKRACERAVWARLGIII